MNNLAMRPVFQLLITNLMQAISHYEKQKTEVNTDNNLLPRKAAQSSAIRQEIVEWLASAGPATAAEVAERFGFHKTTAHSYLNRIVNDGKARVSHRRNRRLFIVDEA